MEKLFEKLKKLTTPTISDRGKMYFVNKKAELTRLIKTSDKITIESRVMGSYENIYYVDITYFEGNEKKEENLVYECDCLNFLENKKPCKHIIATGIAADKEIEAGNIYFKKNREFKMEEEEHNIKREEAKEENDSFETLQKNLGIKKAFSKKNTYNNRLIYLVKDTALISIDKETGEYSIKDNIRDVVQDMGKKYNNCSIHALCKTRNFTKEGLEKNEIIMRLERTISNNEKINFDSFEAPLFISTSDHVTVANRIYFDVINYIEIDNNGNEILNGYQELSNHKGYRKFSVNNDILGVESIRRIDKEEIEEKLLKEKDINIRKLLEKDYLENRDIFSHSKTVGLQKSK